VGSERRFLSIAAVRSRVMCYFDSDHTHRTTPDIARPVGAGGSGLPGLTLDDGSLEPSGVVHTEPVGPERWSTVVDEIKTTLILVWPPSGISGIGSR
jgi:hypothetical protein